MRKKSEKQLLASKIVADAGTGIFIIGLNAASVYVKSPISPDSLDSGLNHLLNAAKNLVSLVGQGDVAQDSWNFLCNSANHIIDSFFPILKSTESSSKVIPWKPIPFSILLEQNNILSVDRQPKRVLNFLDLQTDVLVSISRKYLSCRDFSHLRQTCKTLYKNKRISKAFDRKAINCDYGWKNWVKNNYRSFAFDLSLEDDECSNTMIWMCCIYIRRSNHPMKMDLLKEIYTRLVLQNPITDEKGWMQTYRSVLGNCDFKAELVKSINNAMWAWNCVELGDNIQLLPLIERLLERTAPSAKFKVYYQDRIPHCLLPEHFAYLAAIPIAFAGVFIFLEERGINNRLMGNSIFRGLGFTMFTLFAPDSAGKVYARLKSYLYTSHHRNKALELQATLQKSANENDDKSDEKNEQNNFTYGN